MLNEYEWNVDAWVKKGVLDANQTRHAKTTSSILCFSTIDASFDIEMFNDGKIQIHFFDYYNDSYGGVNNECTCSMKFLFNKNDSKFRLEYGTTGKKHKLDVLLPFDLTEEQYFQYSTVVDLPMSFEYMSILLKAARDYRDELYKSILG